MKTFTVMRSHTSPLGHRSSIPWAWIETHEKQAQTNHYQTLQRLNERGGLCPVELWHVMNDKAWDGSLPRHSHVTHEAAVEWLNGLIELTDKEKGILQCVVDSWREGDMSLPGESSYRDAEQFFARFGISARIIETLHKRFPEVKE